jgi:hypothetical protein
MLRSVRLSTENAEGFERERAENGVADGLDGLPVGAAYVVVALNSGLNRQSSSTRGSACAAARRVHPNPQRARNASFARSAAWRRTGRNRLIISSLVARLVGATIFIAAITLPWRFRSGTDT